MQTKKMNESYFAKLVKEFNAVGEFIRARQEEKQALMNEFDSERRRFVGGRISEKTLISSARKTNKELQNLDKSIRVTIAKTVGLSIQAKKLVANQSPLTFKAGLN